jgi:hypothetical protein
MGSSEYDAPGGQFIVHDGSGAADTALRIIHVPFTKVKTLLPQHRPRCQRQAFNRDAHGTGLELQSPSASPVPLLRRVAVKSAITYHQLADGSVSGT